MSGVKADQPAKVASVTLTLPWAIWHAVDEMAMRAGSSRTEMIRRCVSTEHWRQGEAAKGNQILVLHPDEGMERMEFPY